MFCCYIYFDPRPEKFFEAIYVGKGCLDRPFVHLRHATNPHLDHKLKKIKTLGLTPRIEIIDTESEAQAFMLERFWIKTFGRADLKTGSLCNMTHGGEGQSGAVVSKETRKKVGAFHKGRPKSATTKERMRAKALLRDPSQYEKIIASRIKTLADRRAAEPVVMRPCELCNAEHDGSYGWRSKRRKGRFCGEKCARRFSTRKMSSQIDEC